MEEIKKGDEVVVFTGIRFIAGVFVERRGKYAIVKHDKFEGEVFLYENITKK
jgi:hypothetical protein